MSSASWAQIVANINAPRTQQPTIFPAANGVPQVNIQTPSAAGVSRNSYSQFDVQSKGIVLNNSNADVKTQQAGWVQANPWLTSGMAKVILNEVVSTNPSQINGYIEVAGQRADVIVANPSGISVNGGGFINASKGILTTGTPVFNSNGGIDSYRVQGGNVTIQGSGLDMRTTDYGAILARAVQVNAGIWGNELKVVTGANQVDAASLAANTAPITTPIAPTGSVPAYALDVAAIGGMYVGKIFLVGTEAGLGVRNAGTLSANAVAGGDLVLNNNGWLSNTGAMQAKGDAQVTTQGDVTNAGTLYADGNQNIAVTGKLDNAANGTISSTGNTSVSVTADMTNRGGINGDTTRIASANLTNVGTGRIYGDHIAISTGVLTNDAETVGTVKTAATIAARKRLDIGVQNLNNTNDALIYSDGDMAIAGALDSNNQATGRAQSVVNNGSTIESAKSMQITSQDIQNLNRDLAYKKVVINDVVDTVGASFDTEYVTNSGTFSGDQSLILNGATPNIVRWRDYRAAILWSNSGGRLYVLPSSSMYNTPEYKALYKTDPAVRAAMDAQGALVQLWREYKTDKEILQVTVSNPGKITSGNDMTLNASQTLLNDMSQIVAAGTINISGVNVENRQRTENVTDKRHGMSYNWEHQDEGCGSWKGCSWELDAYWGGYYNENINKTYTLSLASTKQNQSVTSAGVHVSTNSLFRAPANPAATYLIETDPLFANKQQWLGSDYLFTALNLSPSSTQKRLGDGFYEQKLIREQVANLTGKRFLGDYSSDEQQYQALMDNAATVAKAFNLRPGIALTDLQVAQLTSDIVWLVNKTVTLPDGSVTQALVPQIYVRPHAGDLAADGALISGNEVNMQLSGDLSNQGTIAGRKVVSLAANNMDNFNRIVSDAVNLNAQQDINIIGGNVQAQSSLNVTAGRDVNVQSTTFDGGSADGRNRVQGIERVAGLYVSGQGGSGGAAGQLSVKAGQDINLTAATVRNSGKGETTLEAGNTIALKTLTESRSVEAGSLEDHQYVKADQSKEVGSTLQGGGNVTLKAADIHVRAATVESGTDSASPSGTLSLQAQNNVTIEAGQSTQNFFAMEKQSNHGGLLGGDKETITTRVNNSTTAQASNLGGKEVMIGAGNDVTIIGSNVVGDNAVSMTAGDAVVLQAAQNTQVQGVSQQTIEKGFLSGGGLGFSYGERKQSLDSQIMTTTAAASTVGAINGNVTITAVNQYKQVGSDVLSPQGGITITAKTVDIEEAREISKQSIEQKFEQSGIAFALNSTVVSTLQNAQSQIKATEQTKDGRMQALGTAGAAANVKMAADALKAGQGDGNVMVKGADGKTVEGNAADQAGGMSVSVSVGTSKSQSTSTNSSDTARGSTLTAGGNLTIKATGAGEDSNLKLQGSEVGGKTVNLQADNKVNLLAAQNISNQSSDSSNSSASVGLAVQLGNRDSGLGVTASVSKGSGSGNGSETAYTNTHVTGVDDVNIKSGTDTTLKGATVQGKQVTATVGSNLNVESLQDTATYAEKSQQVGASGMIGAGMSGNVNYAKSNINSNYASVTEQSGIKSGDGGFTVNVQGNTDLKGGAITSTQAAIDQNKNSFQTGGTLTTSDIENSASYEAKSVSVSVAAGGTPMPGQGLSAALSGAGMGKDSGSTSSTTTAGISGIVGDTAKRTGDNAQGIAKIFDADKVRQEIQAQTKITQEFAKQASTAIQSYSTTQKQTLQDQIKKASGADKPALQKQLEDAKNEERVLNILVGAVTGLGGTAITKESLAAAADEMRALMIKDSSTFAGVVDSTGKKLSNVSGISEGMNGDGVKLGGTRVDLDLLCGPGNARCKTNSDGSLLLNDKGQVQFDAKDSNNNPLSLDDFLKTPDGQKMAGSTGGVQGYKGTLFGTPYEAGSWQDKLIESFAGTHDMIGGKLSGLYDGQGNIKQGMSDTERAVYNYGVTTTAILPSIPFAAAQGLPPEVWNAVSVLLKAAK